jgi:FkbM family methyltransferase
MVVQVGSQLDGDLDTSAQVQAGAESVFLEQCAKNQVCLVLDVGANAGQFCNVIRQKGYDGFIISFEPQLGCRPELIATSRPDPRWIVMPNMGLGAENTTLLLNITANSYSSSFFETHENHLRSEPLTRAVKTQEVPVKRLADSLPTAIKSKVGALKIDTQGYELEVLKGLGDEFPCLSVIQAELSAIECYVGAPSLEEVDKFITDKLGFRRILLEPGYRDSATNEVQQYDGVYVRDGVENALTMSSGVVIDNVVTSIGQPYTRPDAAGREWGANWFSSCAASWRRFAPSVLSISEVESKTEGVTWVPTKNKPRIVELMQKAEQSTKHQIILTNADILLSDALKDALPNLSPDVFYYGHRLDVDVAKHNPSELVAKGYFVFGYDFFVFPRALLAQINREGLIPVHLRIGEPWWDYVLALLVMHMGWPTKNLQLDSAAVLHFEHKNIINKWNEEQGLQFLQWCQKLKKAGGSPISGLLNELEPIAIRSRKAPVQQLAEASKILANWMT